MSDEPYREFLIGRKLYGLGWWGTELDGWQGGMSGSAMGVDCTARLEYKEGLRLEESEMPSPVGELDKGRCDEFHFDEFGLPVIEEWADYYRLRNIEVSPAHVEKHTTSWIGSRLRAPECTERDGLRE